jgi:hypothetical protein
MANALPPTPIDLQPPGFLPGLPPGAAEDISEGARQGAEQIGRLGDSIGQLIRDLPWSAHTIILGTLVLGLLLWLFGRRSMKLAFAGLGLWGGVVLGVTLPALVGVAAPTWMTGGIGGLIGLVLGLGAFRFTIALSLGALAAVIAPLVAAGILHIRPLPPEASPTRIAPPRPELALPGVPPLPAIPSDGSLHELVPGLLPAPSSGPASAGDTPADPAAPNDAEIVIREGALKVREFFKALIAELRPHWEAQGDRERLVIIASSVAGALLGIALGMMLPRKSAGLVTGFVGAALWMFAAGWLMNLAGMAMPAFLPDTPSGWVMLWAGIGVVGTLFQWTGLLSRKPSGEGNHSKDNRS